MSCPTNFSRRSRSPGSKGKIRFAGVSTHNAKDMVPFLVKKGATDVVLATFNFTMEKAVVGCHGAGQRGGPGCGGHEGDGGRVPPDASRTIRMPPS